MAGPVGRRRCQECGRRFARRVERCPQCGTTWTVPWRTRLVTLGIVVFLVALLYWVIVRYIIPPQDQVRFGAPPPGQPSMVMAALGQSRAASSTLARSSSGGVSSRT